MINSLRQKLLNNLDTIAALCGFIVLLCAAFLVYSKGLHDIYLIAILVGIICVAFYFTYGYKMQINEIQLFNKNWQVWLWLSIICFVGLSQLWYVNLKFPNSLIGLDPWTHARITTQEIDIALLPQPNQYNIQPFDISTIGGYFNLMHLYLRGAMIVTGLSYKWASLIFWGSLQTIGTIVLTYLIGKELIGKGVGILAAFLVSIAGWVVFFNEWNIPNSSGAILCLVTAYLMLRSYKTSKGWFMWLSLIPLALAILTHIVAATWVVGVILCLGVLLAKRRLVSYAMPIVAILLVGGWYSLSTVSLAARDVSTMMQTMPSFGQTMPPPTPIIEPQPLPIITTTAPSTTTPVTFPIVYNLPKVTSHDVLNNGNLGELTLDSLGMFLYIGIAIIGVLMMLKSTRENKAWAILCCGTLMIGFILPLLGYSVLEERWWYLSEVFMAIPLAVALVGVLKV